MVPEDLGEPDASGVYSLDTATGTLYFRQTKPQPFAAPHWEWSTDRVLWIPTSYVSASFYASCIGRPSLGMDQLAAAACCKDLMQYCCGNLSDQAKLEQCEGIPFSGAAPMYGLNFAISFGSGLDNAASSPRIELLPCTNALAALQADSLWYSTESTPSTADKVLIRRLEIEGQLLARQQGSSSSAAAAGAMLPPLDLSQSNRDLSCLMDVPTAFLCPISMR